MRGKKTTLLVLRIMKGYSTRGDRIQRIAYQCLRMVVVQCNKMADERGKMLKGVRNVEKELIGCRCGPEKASLWAVHDIATSTWEGGVRVGL